jgi:DNA-nicking Smr family endonuclease
MDKHDCVQNEKFLNADWNDIKNEFKKNYTNTIYRKYLDEYNIKLGYRFTINSAEVHAFQMKMDEEFKNKVKSGALIKINEKVNRSLLLARLKSLPPGITIDELMTKANKAMQKKNYANAARNFSFCIDKIWVDTSLEDFKTRKTTVRLARLYGKRIECNFELAKAQRSEKIVEKVLADCICVLETGVLIQDIVKAEIDLWENLKQIHKKAIQLKLDIISTLDQVTSKKTRETASQRRRRLQNKCEQLLEETKVLETSFVLDANLCSELGQFEKKLALNASSSDDDCPICYNKWVEFVEPRIAAILPCNHGCCAECLLNYYESCTDPLVDKNERCEFGCPLCRLTLTQIVFYDIANAFVKRNLIESFKFLGENLPFDSDYFDNLIVSLLFKIHRFDLGKVESSLFNMVGLVDQKPNEDLSHEEKQVFYEEARKPVKELQTQLSEIRSKLFYLDSENQDWKEMKKLLDETNQKLQMAIQNASRDIFERINSKEKQLTKTNKMEILSVDLHGLHISEAKFLAKEYILPILDVGKKIMVITGKGIHSKNGKSVLKEAMKDFFYELSIKCEDLLKNDGAFYIFNKE